MSTNGKVAGRGRGGTKSVQPKRGKGRRSRTKKQARAANARKGIRTSSGQVSRAKGTEPDTHCNAATSGGKLCAHGAGWGTDHPGIGRCKLHGGNTPQAVKGAQVVQAKAAVETYGLPREVDPHTALLEELARTAGHVGWLQEQVASMDEEALAGPVGAEGVDAKTGLVHHVEAQPSVWLRLYQQERKHLADVSATCIRVGIEAKRVEIAEQQGQLLAQVLQAVLTELKVPLEQSRPVVRKHLTAIAGGAS